MMKQRTAKNKKNNTKQKNPFKDLTRFEWMLWLTSMVTVTGSFLLLSSHDYLTLIASLIGVTALIFVAKGYVLGQILTVVFAVFYGIISFYFKYYGEMITYLCMTSPIAIMTAISWAKHPFQKTSEVCVNRIGKKQTAVMFTLTAVVTCIFYFILKALGNASLLFSTLSIATSFLASYLTFMRVTYYALAYAANDIILIVLWVLATAKDISYLPMVICFTMFFINDLYGYRNWKKMQKRQEATSSL